ncbi:pseudouridine synthase [Salinifilum ghardaiensis]
MTSKDPSVSADAEGVRLQKALSNAGVASRRETEQMIVEGRIQVNGEAVTELGRRVDPSTATVHVDGARVFLTNDVRVLMLNKPRGILCTMSDDQGRPCLGDYLSKKDGKLFHVGRLDQDTEGMLLLTNDGELANRVMHPSYEVPKTYLAEVQGTVPKDMARTLREGVELEDGLVRVSHFKLVDQVPKRAMVELVLHEGRKRIVRRMLKHVGLPVQRLVRTAIGNVRLTDERPGAIRPLNQREMGALYKSVGL